MEQDTINAIVQFMEMVKKRPGMYTGTDDPAAMLVFLSGFISACQLLGLTKMSMHFDNTYEKVTIERGWEWTSRHPWHEMRERGLSNNEIIQEMVDIQLEVWKRRYNFKEK